MTIRHRSPGEPAVVMSLLRRLKAYRVDWRFSFVPTENQEYEPGIDREVEEDLDKANVISSEQIHSSAYVRTCDGKVEQVPSHAVLLDIDYPAFLIESSTPGHYHLYLDVPGGVPHHIYMELLAVLAKARIIEQGYADVSIARGHSDLRLPWVSKDDQKIHDPSEPEVNLKQVTSPEFDDLMAQASATDILPVRPDDFPSEILPHEITIEEPF